MSRQHSGNTTDLCFRVNMVKLKNNRVCLPAVNAVFLSKELK